MYKPQDHYFKKAKQDNFAARSVYKLEEIQQKFNILKRGDRVLDLGASPGSWTQYASKKNGDKGLVVAVDLNLISIPSLTNVEFIQGDILLEETHEKIRKISDKFDVVLSDMAPKTTGIKITDQERSKELCEMALNMCSEFLCENGNFVTKIFEGPEVKEFENSVRKLFKQVKFYRPQAVRKASFEKYLVALSYQGN